MSVNHTLEQLVEARAVNKEMELTTNHVKKAKRRIKLCTRRRIVQIHDGRLNVSFACRLLFLASPYSINLQARTLTVFYNSHSALILSENDKHSALMTVLPTWILATMCLFFFVGAMENKTHDKISSLSKSFFIHTPLCFFLSHEIYIDTEKKIYFHHMFYISNLFACFHSRTT